MPPRRDAAPDDRRLLPVGNPDDGDELYDRLRAEREPRLDDLEQERQRPVPPVPSPKARRAQ